MENNDLGRALFMDSVKAAEEDGAIPEEDYAVAVDATFIDAPSSTKNKDRARDPEMASGRKAQTWHFGMKLHVAAAVGAGIIRVCVAGPANEHDITRLGDVLTGKETKGVFVDSGYTGCFKREEVAQFNLDPQKWFIAAKPSTVRKYEKLVENQEGTFAEKAQPISTSTEASSSPRPPSGATSNGRSFGSSASSATPRRATAASRRTTSAASRFTACTTGSG